MPRLRSPGSEGHEEMCAFTDRGALMWWNKKAKKPIIRRVVPPTARPGVDTALGDKLMQGI